MTGHIPVLAEECIRALNIQPDWIYIDATYGGGGHTAEILKCRGKVIAFEKDAETISSPTNRQGLVIINDDFRNLEIQLCKMKITAVNGVLADLGISSFQVDNPGRGFSYRWDAALDMRFSRKSVLSASHVVNHYPQDKLAEVLHKYGEIPNARMLASRIIAQRKHAPITTTFSLRDIALLVFRGHNRQQYLSKVFQAIRIEVNDELNALKDLLTACSKVIATGGRLAVITYHSLEDRLVKNFIANGNFTPYAEKDLYGRSCLPFKPLHKKPITPSINEIHNNPRARSAKLRIGEKL